ncbi:TIGR00725 family protein [candidate division KSB1 bacterium]|nr:TIGR00725 family protein [candidate division KSB1 bacterium]
MNLIENHKPIIGVMGGASVNRDAEKTACELGVLIAENGWILLNGGRNAGIMRASAKGAKSGGGLTIGILPGSSKSEANPFIDIPIVTNMADARNLINVLSSDVVVACPGSVGTVSEIALALKNLKPVILLNFDPGNIFAEYIREGILIKVETPAQCINKIKDILSGRDV